MEEITTEEKKDALLPMISAPFTENENGTINCMFELPSGEIVEFTATPFDNEEHGRLIHEMLTENYRGVRDA